MAGTNKKMIGTGVVAASDFKAVTWTGKTKGGSAVSIKFTKAINMGNIDWTFAEKDDTVAEVTFTSVYTNQNAAATDTAEPWEVDFVDGNAAAESIMLGAGVLSIGGTEIALTRGGGSFSVEREFREINADGDRGPVEGRIVMDGSRATLKMNALTILNSIANLYSAVNVSTVS